MRIVGKKKEIFINFLLLTVSILSSLIIVEVFCRYYYFGKISIQKTSPSGQFWNYDERLGWSPKINAEGYFLNPANGIEAYVKFDENGIRENGHLEYTQNHASLLVLGDSTTVGLEVDNDKTYVAILERLLYENNCKVRVYNAGVRGYGTDQSYWRMQTLYDRIQPDHVLYMFSGNDFVNNRTIKKPRRLFGKPVFLLEDNNLRVFNRPAKKFEKSYFAYVNYDKNGKHSINDGYVIEKVLGLESLKEFIKNNLALYHPLRTAHDMFTWMRELLERRVRIKKQEQVAQLSRVEKRQQVAKPSRAEKQQQVARPSRVEKQQQVAQPSRVEKQQQVAQPSRAEKQQQVAQPSRVEKRQQVAQPSRVEKQEQVAKPSRAEKQQQVDKPVRTKKHAERRKKVTEDIDLTVLKLILRKMKSVSGSLFFTSFTKGMTPRSKEFRKAIQ